MVRDPAPDGAHVHSIGFPPVSPGSQKPKQQFYKQAPENRRVEAANVLPVHRPVTRSHPAAGSADVSEVTSGAWSGMRAVPGRPWLDVGYSQGIQGLLPPANRRSDGYRRTSSAVGRNGCSGTMQPNPGTLDQWRHWTGAEALDLD